LLVALGPGRFILKPQAQTFPELPQNELVTMRVAALAGVDVPPCGLLPLSDGSMAYLVKRFDRIDGGGKLRQEDFCQLAGLRAKQKYDGSAELCARLVRRFASEPGIELLKLFRRVVVCWWTGNGDAHLKNFSLLVGTDGLARLSPAYDLLCTRLVIADDQLALPVGGRRDGLARRDFEVYGASCGLPPRAVARELGRVVAAVPAALALVASSPLSPAARAAYAELLASRAASLS
jgi:serine/threonine-protein kinase HipA